MRMRSKLIAVIFPTCEDNMKTCRAIVLVAHFCAFLSQTRSEIRIIRLSSGDLFDNIEGTEKTCIAAGAQCSVEINQTVPNCNTSVPVHSQCPACKCTDNVTHYNWTTGLCNAAVTEDSDAVLCVESPFGRNDSSPTSDPTTEPRSTQEGTASATESSLNVTALATAVICTTVLALLIILFAAVLAFVFVVPHLKKRNTAVPYEEPIPCTSIAHNGQSVREHVCPLDYEIPVVSVGHDYATIEVEGAFNHSSLSAGFNSGGSVGTGGLPNIQVTTPRGTTFELSGPQKLHQEAHSSDEIAEYEAVSYWISAMDTTSSPADYLEFTPQQS